MVSGPMCCPRRRVLLLIRLLDKPVTLRRLCDFGDFGVSDVATVAWRYTRRGGPRRSVQGEPLVVLTRGP